MLIKKEHNHDLTLEFVKYLRNMWNRIDPFTCKSEQQKCELKFTDKISLKKFEELDKYGEYSIEFTGHVIELMMIEEKTGNREAFMFKNVLDALYNDSEIFQIVSKATYIGRR